MQRDPFLSGLHAICPPLIFLPLPCFRFTGKPARRDELPIVKPSLPAGVSKHRKQ